MSDNGKNAMLDEAFRAARDTYDLSLAEFDKYRKEYDLARARAEETYLSPEERAVRERQAGIEHATKTSQHLGASAAQAQQQASRMSGGSRSLAQQTGNQAAYKAVSDNYLSAQAAGSDRFANQYEFDRNETQRELDRSSGAALQNQGLAISSVGTMGQTASSKMTTADQWAPWIQAGGTAIMGAAMLASDENVKENIEDIDEIMKEEYLKRINHGKN